MIKYIATLIFLFAASVGAEAKPIGAMLCPACVIPASGISQQQIDFAVMFVRNKFPKDFNPTDDDVVDVCNANCFQVVFRSGMWRDLRGPLGVSRNGYNGKYINASSLGLSLAPSNFDGSNYTIELLTHIGYQDWYYNGEYYRTTSIEIIDGVSYSVAKDIVSPIRIVN